MAKEATPPDRDAGYVERLTEAGWTIYGPDDLKAVNDRLGYGLMNMTRGPHGTVSASLCVRGGQFNCRWVNPKPHIVP